MSNSKTFTSPFSFLPLVSDRLALIASRSSAVVVPVLGFSLLGGCNPHPLDDVELDPVVEELIEFEFAPQNKVDVLLIVDNSGSMGEEQAKLAQNFSAFVGVLEDNGADYRIAVTTTDVQNTHWCGTSTPENGKLQSSSCRSRLEHFTSQTGVDVSQIACMDVCSVEELGLLPTCVAQDGSDRLRPWIQAGGSVSNLPAGLDSMEAFSCMAPQGIDGCGFESPLEAMRLALLRTLTQGENEFGFLREDAALSVLIVTDEADCSTSDHGQTIFDPSGSRVFWSDPTAVSPTSAVCWNAGVQCSGDASGYDDCIAVDLDAEGNPVDDGDDAVLRPVEDYVEVLLGVLNSKTSGKTVHVSLLGGVPSDFDPTMKIPYAQSEDETFQGKYGVGAGCTSEDNGVIQEAVPPVRMRELVEAFDGTQMFSVCEVDYTLALLAVAEALEPGLRGACVNRCLSDTDAVTPGVQPDCRLTEIYEDGTQLELPECEIVADEWVPPAGFEACVAFLGDLDQETSTRIDDARHHCDEDSGSIAVEVWRTEGSAAPEGSFIAAVCRGDAYSSDCE